MDDTANTSATGGYLTPSSPPSPMDDCLDDILQAVVVGITGLPGDMVRPRWQPRPPKQPEINQDWCAIGIMSSTPDNTPAIVHDGSGDGSSTLRRHTSLDVLASFYGPCAGHYASLLSDGLYIAQNREAMMRDGLALIEVEPIRSVPSLINTLWRRTYDLPIRLRRRVDRIYPILNVEQAVGTITARGGNEDGATTLTNIIQTSET